MPTIELVALAVFLWWVFLELGEARKQVNSVRWAVDLKRWRLDDRR